MIVEHGYGVHNANAYITVAWADSYLAARGITSWAGLTNSQKEQAIIKATDYIEQRFGPRFMGRKTYASMADARNVLTLTGQPAPGDTITIGSQVLNFGTDILIGTTIYQTMNNIVVACNAAFSDIDVELGFDYDVVFITYYFGIDAELITCSTTSAAVRWHFSNFQGGSSVGVSQALSFPRYGIKMADGSYILGIPENLKKATAEYAIRAHTADLLPDQQQETVGQMVKRRMEKLGPLEEEIEYTDVQTSGVRAYPAADALLRPYLSNQGGVYR